jgi:hypothetical protein
MLKAIKIKKQEKLHVSTIKPFDENITNKTSKRTSKWKQNSCKNAYVEAALESVSTNRMNVL